MNVGQDVYTFSLKHPFEVKKLKASNTEESYVLQTWPGSRPVIFHPTVHHYLARPRAYETQFLQPMPYNPVLADAIEYGPIGYAPCVKAP
ncbi:MAG: hypothetical protein DI551_04465 [Micavibrio aeruginosavorus]|uniref:Uncharacterized protein n=1 Tax=Micavibrio aeruginosavorus TaxID=349221 RepID=A0A2W5N2F1_9BACT|nr:MAG: hypothetical protein DI551_04465 [Micavibrio aeruginosavorus]